MHRIGRTGRAGRKGRSFTFANSREIGKIREIERVCHTTITEKKLPGAAKVLKAKADKYLNKAWELHEHEDIELMKSFLQRKMEEEGCDEYFLLGDNETASDDSREEKIGNIKKKEIYGEVWFVIKPWSDIGFVSD